VVSAQGINDDKDYVWGTAVIQRGGAHLRLPADPRQQSYKDDQHNDLHQNNAHIHTSPGR
jgi:hypothetical protein